MYKTGKGKMREEYNTEVVVGSAMQVLDFR